LRETSSSVSSVPASGDGNVPANPHLRTMSVVRLAHAAGPTNHAYGTVTGKEPLSEKRLRLGKIVLRGGRLPLNACTSPPSR
jgi:hypothetical protein